MTKKNYNASKRRYLKTKKTFCFYLPKEHRDAVRAALTERGLSWQGVGEKALRDLGIHWDQLPESEDPRQTRLV